MTPAPWIASRPRAVAAMMPSACRSGIGSLVLVRSASSEVDS